MSQQMQWVYDPNAARRKLKPTAADKNDLEVKAHQFLATLKKKKIKPPPKKPSYNYLVDIGTKWHGRYFYFFSTYNSPGRNALSPSFDINHARMAWVGPDQYDLAFCRHTGEWITLWHNQSTEECFDSIKNDPWFYP
jgi:hypothetical protein